MSRIADEKHPQFGRCANPGCERNLADGDQSGKHAQTSSEGEICDDTVAIPLEMLRSASGEQEVILVGDAAEGGEKQEDSSERETPVLRIEVVGDALAWLRDELRKRGLSSVIRVRVEFAEPDEGAGEHDRTK